MVMADAAPKGARGKRISKIKAMTSKDIKKRRPWMILASGDEGTGKTHFCLTYLLYAYYEVGLESKEIMMIMIDPDDGVARLLDVDVVPEKLQERIIFYYPKSWKDLIAATDDAYERLAKHIDEHGLRGWRGSIITVENKGLCWDWAQDDYVQEVYKKTLMEKALDAKKIAIADEKSMHPTLSPMRDYGVINKKYDAWADGIKNSGFNFIWTAHFKAVTVSEGEGKAKVVKEKVEGKRNIGGKVDVLIKFHQDDGKFKADITKGRGLSTRVENQENMDFTEFVRLFNLLQANDKKRRDQLFVNLEKKRRLLLKKREEVKRKKEEEKVTMQKDAKSKAPPEKSQTAEQDMLSGSEVDEQATESSEEAPSGKDDGTDLSDLMI